LPTNGIFIDLTQLDIRPALRKRLKTIDAELLDLTKRREALATLRANGLPSLYAANERFQQPLVRYAGTKRGTEEAIAVENQNRPFVISKPATMVGSRQYRQSMKERRPHTVFPIRLSSLPCLLPQRG